MATKVTLHSRFPEIIVKLPASVEVAVRVGAERIAQDAQTRVPVATGKLRQAIHVEDEDNGSAVYAGDQDVFYGHLVEYGTSHTPARPFLIPAMHAQSAGIVALTAEALRRL